MASSDPSPNGDEREVFSGLPNARPHRRSAKRDRPARGAAAASGAATGTTATPAAAKPKARSKPKAKPAPKPAATKVPPAGYATPAADDDVPRGADLVGTAVKAVGELAQIGVAAGGRALKGALQRLPRP
jgi:hypothetical protein